jgi:hypothetical protein
MAMVAHDPAAAKRMGIPQSVGKEFVSADKGKKFGGGEQTRPDRQTVNKPKTSHGKSALFSKGGHVMATKKMASGGITKAKMGKVTAGGIKAHGEHTVQKSGHTKGKNVVMKAAGKPLGMKKGGKC